MRLNKTKNRKWSWETIEQVKALSEKYLPGEIAMMVGLKKDNVRAIQDYEPNGIVKARREYGMKDRNVGEEMFDYNKMGRPF
jgi:3-keto-L-gulonate-6-phosphate decarboxylase